jgi:acyl dehydratase
MPIVFESPESLSEHVGNSLGTSSWFTMSQAAISSFADVTQDHQWIHIDHERAAASAFGSTIAHGYLVLAMLPKMVSEVYEIKGVESGINYGADRIRFLTPVPSGARIRCNVSLSGVSSTANGVQINLAVTVELEGSQKPALVADVIYRYLSA